MIAPPLTLHTGILYNDIDPFCCEWLRRLMAEDLIPQGDVLCKSITEITPDELEPYHTFHAFAGLGGWAYALRIAGWPHERPVWTGSCPCQPFSAAGNQRGMSDERHLWPAFANLIRERRPSVVLGEQVASAIAHGWLDTVAADLEGEGYAFGSAILGAHSVGAPHKRQRLYWGGFALADCSREGFGGRSRESERENDDRNDVERCGGAGAVDNANGSRRDGAFVTPEGEARDKAWLRVPSAGCGPRSLGHPDDAGPQGRGLRPEEEPDELNPWTRGIAVVECTDGRKRLVEPGSFPLAHGVSGRVGRLRAYGNAIVPAVAAAFIQAAAGAMKDMEDIEK